MSFFPPVQFAVEVVAGQAMAGFEAINLELEKLNVNALKANASLGTVEKGAMIAKVGFLAAAVAAGALGKVAVEASMANEQAVAKLSTTLKNVGDGSAETLDKVNKLSEGMTNVGFSAVESKNAYSTLLTATKSVSDSTHLMSLAMDMARFKHISLQEATAALAKGTQGNGKAFKEFGVTLDSSLPKQQAINKALTELQQRLGGQTAAYADTLSGKIAIMKSKFELVAEHLGNVLIPILSKFVSLISGAIKFIEDNSNAIKALGIIVLIAAGIWKGYEITLIAVNAVQKLQIALALASAEGIGAMKAAQLLLNDAMKANMIGLIVVALTAVAAGFIYAWNHSETFRKVVVTGIQIVVNAFGYLLGYMSKFLEVLSHLPIVGKMFGSASKSIGDAANEVRKFSDGLDKLKDKQVKVTTEKTPTSSTDIFNLDNYSGATKKVVDTQQKLADKYQKIVTQMQDKIVSATKTFNDTMVSLDSAYNVEVSKLNQDAANKIKDLTDKTNQKIADEQKKFNDFMLKLNQKHAEDLAKLSQDNQDKIAQINQSGLEKLASIVQQSVDRLRSAFAQGTSFSVGDIFKGLTDAGTASVDSLLSSLKTKLEAAKELAANAAKLQSLGFSQTFIEQVVSQGPEIGNKLAESLVNATPDTIKELQKTYVALENTTNHGLDALGSVMSTSAHLATDELTKAYQQAQVDIQKALEDQAKSFLATQTEINKTFNDSMAEAEKSRDEAISALLKDLADTTKTINDDLATALQKAFDDLTAKQDEAKKKLSDALDVIQKDFDNKLGKIKKTTQETTTAINGLIDALNTARALAAMPMPTPAPSAPAYNPLNGNAFVNTTGSSTSTPIVINQQITNTTPDASATLSATVSAIKFGYSGSGLYSAGNVGSAGSIYQ